MTSLPSSDPGDSPAGLRRRSSTLSDFSLSEARRSFRDGTKDILNPNAAEAESTDDNSSMLSTFPLVFALLPAIVGLFFEGGNALITDVMLLGLVFIFLRYTITQPWQWYHEAQGVRIRQEVDSEQVFDDESETELPANMTASTVTLDEVPEETGQDDQVNICQEDGDTKVPVQKSNRARSHEAVVNELYIHEVLALISCFLGPVLGAYILHAIRAQLTRPSEGLLTDFNITVFLLAAELRPISHAMKLVQARTLHLQRIVQSTPVEPTMMAKFEEMRLRLAQLECRATATEEATAASLASSTQQVRQQGDGPSSSKQEAALVREVRNAIQPELDALNRAVRRYERKATVLALQTESRLGVVDMRLNDAVSLAAAAAARQTHTSNWGMSALLAWITNGIMTIVMMPYHIAMYFLIWPFRTVAGLCFSKGSRSSTDRRTGSARPSRHTSLKGLRHGSSSDKDRYKDRVPSRLSRRYSP